MKRSEAIKKLIPKVISPFEVIRKEYYDDGTYERRAIQLLDFIERELGMLPPDTGKGWPIVTVTLTGNHDHSTQLLYEWDKE